MTNSKSRHCTRKGSLCMIILLNTLFLTYFLQSSLFCFLRSCDINLFWAFHAFYEKGDSVINNFDETGTDYGILPFLFPFVSFLLKLIDIMSLLIFYNRIYIRSFKIIKHTGCILFCKIRSAYCRLIPGFASEIAIQIFIHEHSSMSCIDLVSCQKNLII